MAEIEIFLQGAGIARIALVRVSSDSHVRDLIDVARSNGLTADGEQPRVWLENADEPLDPDLELDAAGIKNRSRVQVHTCHRIVVTVNFKADSKTHPFAPSATIGAVKAWAEDKFKLSGVDATEYALQLCNTSDRPADDIQLGSLTTHPHCSVCFDLVPKQRVEG